MLLLYVNDLFLIEVVRRRVVVEFEMKDLDMMHYFISMGVWQNADGIYLRQRKYAMEILNRFKMMECKTMTTPMASNMKLLSVASSESVDATMYRQMICSLMCLTSKRLDTCLL